MTLSYKWLHDYLPVTLEPEKLSRILTSVGLEVESFYRYEEVKGGLKGLIIGEVLETSKHPNADKLTLTKVDTGNGEAVQIVCGAPNVAAGQKVVVALPGTTIHPINGEPLKLKAAKIRGEESHGMICAEDEIGLGDSHAGIMVLSDDAIPGTPAKEYFEPYDDWIYEIGLTPNRMDAMSHWGVARDVCAWLSHHDRKGLRPKLPLQNGFRPDNRNLEISVKIENPISCARYSGISLTGVKPGASPKWMQQRLKAIGVRPINNIVDITNYIQHETGQPLHAFDADKLAGKSIIVKNLPAGTPFITLDGKERKLDAADLMICDADGGICIAGIFGGLHSGITDQTVNVFLESAWFHPTDIRRSSFRHGLRTDAATRFEKGIDISNTVHVLKHAAMMMREHTGALIASDIIDIYPKPAEKKEIVLKFHYLKKLSGKSYHPDTARNILESLGFELKKEGMDELWVAAPFHKPDIELPADVVEEILRIDGLDNIAIPQHITIAPSSGVDNRDNRMKEKLAGYLTGLGFQEIMTNSITDKEFYAKAEQKRAVTMLNSLSAELNTMRLSLLETGLQSIAWNLNRKNNDLKFFEFGKTYSRDEDHFNEKEELAIFVTGQIEETGWKGKPSMADFYYLKGVAARVLEIAGVNADRFRELRSSRFEGGLTAFAGDEALYHAGTVGNDVLQMFGIKQPVYFCSFEWEKIVKLAANRSISFREIPKFPVVHRDLSIVVDQVMEFENLKNEIAKLYIPALREVKLFDVFVSEKLGAGKKSFALNFQFVDEQKTLTDTEIDEWMQNISNRITNNLNAEIRK